MEKTIGQIIKEKRAEKGLTQEQLAEILHVTGQAVSKWERDESVPDVTLLKPLAKALGTTVGELLGEGTMETTRVDPETVDLSKMLLKIHVDSKGGDKVRVNFPVSVLMMLTENEELMNMILSGKGGMFKNIDFNQILKLVTLGVMGKLVEVESADGDVVGIWVE
ncbi:MAG: helix-turn-helix transcriptional regulator [Clostridia bacterium]|nr:helix-turn-helix transcriptional regulator [Clostridia bacterium]